MHMTLQKPMRIEHSKKLRVYVAREVILIIFSWISVFKKHALWKPSTGVGDMNKMFNFRPTVRCKTNFTSPRTPLIESFAFVEFQLCSRDALLMSSQIFLARLIWTFLRFNQGVAGGCHGTFFSKNNLDKTVTGTKIFSGLYGSTFEFQLQLWPNINIATRYSCYLCIWS